MKKFCITCTAPFEISTADREFYQNIHVPEPTHCPLCRMQRRMAFRNERNLYQDQCDLCKKSIISMYSADKPFTVYCQDCWWSDKWKAEDFSRDFDFNRPFFEQFQELMKVVPRIALLNVNRENSEYCNFTGDVKNSYLIFGSVYSEDCLYGSPYYSKDCLDTLVVRECEWCYECTDCRKLHNGLFCQDCYNSSDLLFCFDLQGCQNCIGCAALRNKKYHVYNQPYSKEEYLKLRQKLNLYDPKIKKELQQKLAEIKQAVPHRFMQMAQVQNVSGNHVYNSKNTFYSFLADRCEDCSYCAQVVDLKNCSDNNYTEENELCYEYLGMYATQSTHFSLFCRHTYDVRYSDYCIQAKSLFGCSGIRDNQYCILNKKYSKEEYEALITRIMEHMRTTPLQGQGPSTSSHSSLSLGAQSSESKTGSQQRCEWGEFFPVHISPFAYNETVAHEYFPLKKEEVLQRGWRWRKPEEPDFSDVTKKIPAEKLPQNISDIPDEILDWVIECAKSRRLFKIQKKELEFYRRLHLPIPHLHPDERHRDRMAMRTPRRLWKRNCAKCQKEIETTYAPDRAEKVYCESCYLKNVY